MASRRARTAVDVTGKVTVLNRDRGQWSDDERKKLDRRLSGTVVFDHACPSCILISHPHDLTDVKRALDGSNGFDHQIVRANHPSVPPPLLQQLQAVLS